MANAFLGQGSNYVGFGNGSSDASDVAYDNSESGVVASNVQDALDGLFYLTAKKSVTVEGYHGLSALCQRYGEVVIITITGQTNAAINAGVDEIPIPEGYRPSDTYTHDFAVSYDANWNVTLGNIYNNNIRFRHNIASGVYVRGTCTYII